MLHPYRITFSFLPILLLLSLSLFIVKSRVLPSSNTPGILDCDGGMVIQISPTRSICLSDLKTDSLEEDILAPRNYFWSPLLTEWVTMSPNEASDFDLLSIPLEDEDQEGKIDTFTSTTFEDPTIQHRLRKLFPILPSLPESLIKNPPMLPTLDLSPLQSLLPSIDEIDAFDKAICHSALESLMTPCLSEEAMLFLALDDKDDDDDDDDDRDDDDLPDSPEKNHIGPKEDIKIEFGATPLPPSPKYDDISTKSQEDNLIASQRLFTKFPRLIWNPPPFLKRQWEVYQKDQNVYSFLSSLVGQKFVCRNLNCLTMLTQIGSFLRNFNLCQISNIEVMQQIPIQAGDTSKPLSPIIYDHSTQIIPKAYYIARNTPQFTLTKAPRGAMILTFIKLVGVLPPEYEKK